LGAPASVVGALFIWQDVFLVFAAYHLGFCLVLPLWRNLGLRRGSWRDHFGSLGLTGPGTSRGMALGLALGLFLATAAIGFFRWQGGNLLASQEVGPVLAGWGVDESNQALMFWFMILVNGPAEELYWRGFVHSGLRDRRPRWATLLLVAGCYASYHGVTIGWLVTDRWVALLFTAAILVMGFLWGVLRERTGSVWPALLSHWAAAAAYMWVARPLMQG